MNKNDINPSLGSLENDVMGFLNEIQMEFPEALSFASGRPDEGFFEIEKTGHYFTVYTDYLLKNKGQKAVNALGQYDKARGLINDIVAEYLKKQYNIHVAPEDILVNVGSQEGMMLALTCLFNKETDVLAVEDPTYVGISDYAKIIGQPIQPISVDDNGISLAELEIKIHRAAQTGKRVKAVYVIPDFQNPTGCCMPPENRHALLRMAEEFDFYIIEDNAYGDFVLEGKPLPTLKSLDTGRRVIYLHSMSKIAYPSLRIGIMVADQVLADGSRFSGLLAKVKGYTTVNTPALTQAVLAGMLLENDFDLNLSNEGKLKNLSLKRASILRALEKYFPKKDGQWAANITWNTPKGGFFLGIKLPIPVTNEHIRECAQNFGVIFTPMSFFYLGGGGEKEIRLAFSYIPLDKIEEGVSRLARYIKQLIERNESSK